MARKIKTLLLIDLYGCALLQPDILYLCMEQFLKEIDQRIAALGTVSRIGNVWGTIVYISCDSEKEAGKLALDLSAHLQKVDWQPMTEQEGHLEMLMLLHTGPVHVSSKKMPIEFMVGPYGELARTLQKLDPEGQIFTTEEFAALVACEGVEEFQCEYQGLATGIQSRQPLPVYKLKSSIMCSGRVESKSLP